jgi:hypothetical protein
MSAPDDDEDAIVVDWQRGWEPTPDDDDPPPPSQWHDPPPPSGDWRQWDD